MKILVVQETDWISRGPHNSHHLMERLSTRGHEIRVIDYDILWSQKNNERDLVSKRKIFYNQHKSIDNGNITVIRPSIIKLPFLNYLSLIYTHEKEIKREIFFFKPDIIVGLALLNANMAIRLAKNNNIPFVYFVMDRIHELVPQKYFRFLAANIEKYNMKNADRVVSVNEGLREYTILMGAKREKTNVIKTAIDFNHFKLSTDGMQIREKYGIKNDEIVLFFMGWLYTFSGLKELALEIAKLPENSKIKLIVLGNGELWDTLQDIKTVHRLEDKILTINWKPYEDVPKYIAASDICLLPAYKNKTMEYIVPIKLYEYMAMGKPVIATRLYGVEKEFGDNNGIIYIDTHCHVLDKVFYLIKNKFITEEGKKSLQFVKNNSWDKITDSFENYLLNIVASYE